jgi:uncharacterized protein YodC (DUF2158 family)
VFKIGDLVTLKSGGPDMTVFNKVEGKLTVIGYNNYKKDKHHLIVLSNVAPEVFKKVG